MEQRPSARELEILSLIGGGKTDKQVAAALGISRSTVESHVASLRRKLGAATRAQMVLRAKEAGLLDAPPGASTGH